MARDPLVELPLERFLSSSTGPDAARSSSSKRSAQKRPLSPGLANTLISPAKRRMLAQVGLVSPLRTRSPLSDFAAHSHAPDTAPSRLFPTNDGKREPTPPAFLGEENVASGRENVGSAETTPRATRTSPRLAARRASISSSATRRTPRANSVKATSPPLSREGSPLPIVISRPRAPTPNRDSEHYPGFDIHYDNHIVLERVRSPEAPSQPISRGEADKENLRPKRGRKTTGTGAEKDKKTIGGAATATPRRSPRLSDAQPSSDVAMAFSG
ncbi:hypothetical protein K488DRAFT_85014 [Vararia minispora EC-137]|uniref:Uncharacterized protein n=1 Tax=Vararia minispora EC-137 TaxID=1314806 RepID=A0ACB8QNT2_9AGAM|nr:hypothetical protein K488DRAFT_85014 [Vararia minispora EC-137]